MSDYISREAAKQILSRMLPDNAAECACNLIDSVLPADVEPVRRIQWTPYADGQTDTSGFAADDDYLLRTSTGYILPGYWDDQFKEWTVPIEYDAAKDWADKFGQIVGFMKIQRPEDPA